jgi:hypothetical protein
MYKPSHKEQDIADGRSAYAVVSGKQKREAE